MVNTTYFELTSAHRDRNRDPYPSHFTLDMSFSGRTNTVSGARDPVYNSVIIYPPPMLPQTYPSFGYLYGLGNDTTVGAIPIVDANGDIVPLRDMENAYVGDVLELITHVEGLVVYNLYEYRIITGYKIVPTEYIVTTVDNVQPILPNSIPLSSSLASDIDNIFVGWTVTFTVTTDPTALGISRVITYYRGFDRRIFFDQPITETISGGDTVTLSLSTYSFTIDHPFSVGQLPNVDDNTSFENNTIFRIRSGGNLPTVHDTFVSGTPNTAVFPNTVGATDYNKFLIWLTSDPVVLSDALVSGGFIASGGTQVQGTFELPPSASSFPDDFLNGMHIQLTSGAFDTQKYTITDWDNATLTGTVTPGWTSVIVGVTNPIALDTFTITQPAPSIYRVVQSYNKTTKTATINPPFSYTTSSGVTMPYSVGSIDTFELLQYNHDNYVPLDYPDSTVTQQQPHCFTISLISLTLPNVVLKSGFGGKITSYPYVYVEFKNVTQGTSAYDFITNNPNISRNVMFIAPMIYNYRPELAKFVVLDGHGMIQTLKFKPNDAFTFAVYLPNGELFLTEDDYMSPSEPNPFLQITACFGVTRI